MLFGHIISSPRGHLSLRQTLRLINVYLENASKEQDPDVAMVLCHDTEVSLSQAKKLAKRSKNQAVHKDIGAAYKELGKVLESKGYGIEARASYQKAEKWEPGQDQGHSLQPSESKSIESPTNNTPATVDTAGAPSPVESKEIQGLNPIGTISQHIFTDKVPPPNVVSKLPQPDERLISTPQLACCLSLLRASYSLNEVLEPVARDWLQSIANDEDEDERLKMLSMDVIRAYKRDEIKDSKIVSEVVCLAPVLDKQIFRDLLDDFYTGIDQAGMLKFQLLDGLAQMVQGADPGYLDADDLVKILQLLSSRLRDTHGQSRNHIYQLTMAASRVLDAMADTKVTGLDREALHLPLTNYLNTLKKDHDPCMVFQAAYAYQALLCVPDDESLWKATIRRTGKVIKGVSGLVSAVKGLDLNGFIEGLGSIQQGFEGVADMIDIVKTTVEGVSSLVEGGKTFIESLKEGLSFQRKCAWYSALRGADELIRQGEFASFKKLVCEAPCRLSLPFQWGVCQRLGEVAANPSWDVYTRRNAVSFLGEIYAKDEDWGHQESVKQWIIDILLIVSSSSENSLSFAETLLQELEKNAPPEIKTRIQSFRQTDPDSRPLKITFPPLETSTLLDRVQNKPDVESVLRQIKRHRQKERGESVFIQPQAKGSFKASDEDRFDLMDRMKEFIGSDQKVFLLLGDSGSGKSTFNLQLECNMWNDYKKGTGMIPLHINLPAIEKPEQDMIPKQLRKLEFTEPEIRELKNRNFLLICDGYDESQQTQNLYVSNRLNRSGEWKAQMVITCRSEYVGVDYKDRFQPGDRNNRTNLGQFQEAVMTPFTVEQIDRYVDEYVKVNQPLWEANEYKTVLSNIPSLMELVKNPFLMTLSLEVLPRIVDPKQQLAATRVTRVSLYDQFIVHWLERGKKRLSEEELNSQTKAAFQSLVDEGFTQNGVDFLKRLAVAIFKEQGGQPVVKYSRFKDEGSWKSAFFSREDEKQLLREACPLTRSGNQHRFVHRSLLEYGLALAIFDPQDWKEKSMAAPASGRRGSTASIYSFHVHGSTEAAEEVVEAPIDDGPDPNSPLAWRYYINEPSVIHFLAERAQQEQLFKQQLLEYIERSKEDKEKKWRIAAANAISILVKAGETFIGADLRHIQVPGADLSNGVFDSAQLQGADLRRTNLRNVWLRQANLNGARMSGVQFGELPLVKLPKPVLLCAYSPDGKSFAVCPRELKEDITMYSTSTWDISWELKSDDPAVGAFAFSPNSAILACGYGNGSLRLLDAASGATVRAWTGHDMMILGVAYSPLGDMIASASFDQTVRLWDVESGDCRRTLTGHTRDVICVAFSPKGNQVASGSRDTTVRLWDITTGDCQTLNGHDGRITSVAYSPQGHVLASAGDDRSIHLWDLETRTCCRTLSGHSSGVLSVAFSRLGDLIASGGEDKTVRLWDTETGECRQTFSGHIWEAHCVTFSPTDGCVTSSGKDATLRFWDIGAGAPRQVAEDQIVAIRIIKYLPKTDQIACHRLDGSIQLFNGETGSYHLMSRDHDEGVYNVVYSQQNDKAAGNSVDGTTVQLWNVTTGACRVIATGHTDLIKIMEYSPQGDLFLTGSADTTVKIWNVETGECSHTLNGHTDLIITATFSPDSGQVASGGWDMTVRLWDAKTGVCSHVLQGHSDWVWALAYSPSGNQVASGDAQGTIKLWDTTTGDCINTLTGHKKAITYLLYSPQGDVLASTSSDETIRLWDTATSDCRAVLPGNSSEANSMFFIPKDNLFVVGCVDKVVRLWDTRSGQCRVEVRGFNGRIQSVDWKSTPDGDYLITGSYDGSVQMWTVVTDGDSCRVQLRWSSMTPALTVTDASLERTTGLSRANRQLMKQRGAVGEPSIGAREASMKLINIASVLSKLRRLPSETPQLDSTSTHQLAEQPEHPAELVVNP